MLAEVLDRQTVAGSTTSTSDVAPVDNTEIDRLLRQFTSAPMSGFYWVELQPASEQPPLRVVRALNKIDDPVITRDSASADAAFIEELRRKHPVPLSDFPAMPEKSQ